jgi:hypothetical protein
VLAWILAVLIRLATGSATVATITASSLIIGLVEGMSTGQVSLRTPELGAVRFTHNPALDDLIEATVLPPCVPGVPGTRSGPSTSTS